jgi:branched-chain amino acid transport system substrate-binding protein
MKKGILIYLMALLLPSFFILHAQAAEPIKIGFVHTLSGTYACYGVPCRDGAEIAISEINQAGGVLGRPIELLARDDKVRPEPGLREAKDLVFTHKVDLLMGTVSSAVGLALSKFAKEQKIIFLNTTSQSDVITAAEGHRYVFRISTNTSAYCRTGARWAARLPYTKWYQIDPDYTYGHSCHEIFKAELKKLKPAVQFVGEDWPKLGNPDYTPFITKILSSGAEAAYTSVAGADFVTFVKQAMPFRYFDRIAHMGHDLGSYETVSPLGDRVPSGKIAGGSHFPFWAIETPEAKAFTNMFHEKTGIYPGVGAVGGYVTIYTLAQAIKKAGSFDTEKIIDALEGITVQTIVGPLTINDYDHQATWPFWFGKVVLVPEYPFGILTDMLKFPAEEVYQSEEEVRKLRAQ